MQLLTWQCQLRRGESELLLTLQPAALPWLSAAALQYKSGDCCGSLGAEVLLAILEGPLVVGPVIATSLSTFTLCPFSIHLGFAGFDLFVS